MDIKQKVEGVRSEILKHYKTILFALEKSPFYKKYMDNFKPNKNYAIVIALIFGGIGLHRFYMRNLGWGIVYLLLYPTYLPLVASLLDVFIYIRSSDKFCEKALKARDAGPFGWFYFT